MSETAAARTPSQPGTHAVLRLVALAAVAVGVLLLTAAAFALSYGGIHATVLAAGVSASLARLYPLIFDAMLVVATAAVLSLREAGLATRCYAWLVLLALIAAAAGADALHATGTHLPHRSAAAVAAILPWALVLIAFSLLLAMLRHARLRQAAQSASRPPRSSDAVTQLAAVAADGEARAHWQGSAATQDPVLSQTEPASGSCVARTPDTDPGPGPAADAAPEPAADAAPEPEPGPGPAADAAPEPEPDPGPGPAADTDTDTDPDAAPDPEPAADTDPAMDPRLSSLRLEFDRKKSSPPPRND
ncbi:MAG TPA: DUF2637 domain-containing protein [Streptosporangiaceae bacterium]|nr:DUF2637 domain-containing protein [Streptosporangiaceae bacterium]